MAAASVAGAGDGEGGGPSSRQVRYETYRRTRRRVGYRRGRALKFARLTRSATVERLPALGREGEFRQGSRGGGLWCRQLRPPPQPNLPRPPMIHC